MSTVRDKTLHHHGNFKGLYINVTNLCNYELQNTFNKLTQKFTKYTSCEVGNPSKVVPNKKTTSMKNEPNYSELAHWAQYFPADENKLGTFLKRRGDPIGLRLDFRITTLKELKRCCVILEKLSVSIQKYAYKVDGDASLRVMLAREQFREAKYDLKFIDDKAIKERAEQKELTKGYLERGKKFTELRLQETARLAVEALANHEAMKEAREAKEKLEQEYKLSKPKRAVIDLGNVTLGILPAAKKQSKIVSFAVRKKAVG